MASIGTCTCPDGPATDKDCPRHGLQSTGLSDSDRDRDDGYTGSGFPQSAERGCGVSGKEAARDGLGQPARVRIERLAEALWAYEGDPDECWAVKDRSPERDRLRAKALVLLAAVDR